MVIADSDTGAILALEGRDGGRSDPTLASTRAYVTGSTLATLTFAAALDAKTLDVSATLDCSARQYGDARLSDRDEYGSLPVTDALAISSKVGTSRVYDTIGLPRLLAVLKALHVGDPPGALPPIQDPAGIEPALLAVGETAKATPLQMTAAYAALLNGGIYRALSSSSGPRAETRVFQLETAKTMTGMLEDIVMSQLGTAKLAQVEDLRVAGKTGTSAREDGSFFASFIGTVLGGKPRVVVYVGLDAPRNQGTGASSAAPVFARVATRLVDLFMNAG